MSTLRRPRLSDEKTEAELTETSARPTRCSVPTVHPPERRRQTLCRLVRSLGAGAGRAAARSRHEPSPNPEAKGLRERPFRPGPCGLRQGLPSRRPLPAPRLPTMRGGGGGQRTHAARDGSRPSRCALHCEAAPSHLLPCRQDVLARYGPRMHRTTQRITHPVNHRPQIKLQPPTRIAEPEIGAARGA